MSLSLFRKKSFVGLDLGHHSIKAVQMERTAGGWKITHVGTAPTPPESIKDGVVVDTDQVAQAIRQAMKSGRLTATAANISVAGASVVVRNVRIPKMPENTLRKSIKFEAGRYVPTSVEDSFIEFEILGAADENQMDVLIVASPKDIVESRVRACEAAGLEVEVVDIEPFAAFRALVESDIEGDWRARTFALVDIGSNTTNVSVIANGVFAMTRSIPNGGKTFTEALKSYFKLSEEDAEAGKYDLDFRNLLGDGGPAENPPLRVLQPHMDDLIREMRRSLNYYQSQQTEAGQAKAVTDVIVSGGGANMAGTAEYIGTKLGMNVVPSGIFDNPRFLCESRDETQRGLELSVASGLAMRSQMRAA